jgi:NAD(P)-dependent dehydrogenase (short-subunit alcohol dehydrogenase family)
MMRLDGIEGRTAFVSGGARGIGRCAAETLRDLGARVASCDLEEPAIDGVLGLQADVSDEAAVDHAVTRVEKELGHVELLVLNAGILIAEPFERTEPDAWRRLMDVNLGGAYLCARRVLPGMRTAGFGRVVVVGSSAGKTGGGTASAAYSASKAAIMTFAKSIAKEYAAHGVLSNAVAPALIDTEMLAGVEDLRDKIPLKRYGEVQEVADVIAFLCSAHASFITGEIVDVNGGFVMD